MEYGSEHRIKPLYLSGARCSGVFVVHRDVLDFRKDSTVFGFDRGSESPRCLVASGLSVPDFW